jgi:hypothetical protein
MIAAVNNRGLMRFKLYKGALNVAIFTDFLKRLIKDAKQKVFLIVDNLRVHHAKAVHDWLARYKDEIEIFYLPAYAPEHNPDEYLNNDLKQTIKNKPRAKTRDDLVAHHCLHPQIDPETPRPGQVILPCKARALRCLSSNLFAWDIGSVPIHTNSFYVVGLAERRGAPTKDVNCLPHDVVEDDETLDLRTG